MPEKPSRSALKVCAIYAMAAGAWILLSDRAVAFLLPDAHRITSFQTLKGLAFVLTTSGLLYLVMRRQLRRQWEEQGRRQNAEVARTQSQQQIRALFEAEPECLEVLESDSTARHINPAGLSLIEADGAAQVLGKPLLPLVVPEDRAAVSAVLEAAARGERGGLEFRITTLKGTERWIEMRATPFQDLDAKRPLILALSRDISSRKQTEAALSLSKERLRACIESSPNVAVQWYDESGQVIFWNQASEVMFGWAANEALGRKRDELTQTATQAARFGETLQEIKRTGTKIGPRESEFHRKDGSRGVCLSTVFAIPFDGQRLCYVCMDVDVTERERSQQELRQSVSLLQATLEATADGILVVDAAGRLASFNRKFAAMWSLPAEALGPHRDGGVGDLIKEQLASPEEFMRSLAEAYKHPESPSFDVLNCRDGRTIERHSQPQRLGDQIVGRVWSFRDVTERRRTERMVVQSELRLRLVWENVLQAMRLTDAVGTVVLVNSAYCKTVGKSRAELEGQPFTVAYTDGDRRQALADYLLRFTRHQEAIMRPEQVTYWNGRKVQLEVTDVFLEITGQTALLLTIVNDVTDRNQAEARARVFAEMARQLSAANTPRAAGEIIMAAAQKILGWDACFLSLYDTARNRIENVVLRDTIGGRVVDVPVPADYEVPSAVALDVLQNGERLISRTPGRDEPANLTGFGDAARKSASLLFAPICEGRRAVGVLSVQSYTPDAYDAGSLATLRSLAEYCTGTLERLRAEENLRKREAQFRSFIENGSDLITVVNQAGVIRFQSPSAERLLGFRPEEMTGRQLSEFVHPDEAAAAAEAIQKALAAPNQSVTFECRLRHRDSSWRRIQSLGRSTAEHAEESWIIFNSRDVTESRSLEEQFRHSQKMEAIGQLAGGVAHDFNNLLGVIQMQVELLKLEPGLPPEQLEATNEIGKAAQRAANLTRQLLMFSRRQVLKQREVDLNEIVANVAKMLQRLLGEHIAMQVNYTPASLIIRADNVMIDQILMNLAVNSRDAMPDGGRLTIETSRAEFDAAAAAQLPLARAGRFACLTVADSGCGIPLEVLPHIFEPFFTTKDVGKGTGLGLATVFGLVQQHQGWIQVQSESGQGTTFRVYLPLLSSGRVEPGHDTTLATVERGTETILLVEDEVALRTLIRTVLTRLGYRVIEASTGLAALGIWKTRHNEIQLLLTDLVMPDGVSGKELAQRLLAEKPSLKVIYTSGYSQDITGEDFPLQEGENFLAKPFQATKLARIVRARLDR